MWVVVHVLGLGLLVQGDIGRAVRTQRRGLVVDSQVLLQLPTAGETLRLGLANRLGQHECADYSQKLVNGEEEF